MAHNPPSTRLGIKAKWFFEAGLIFAFYRGDFVFAVVAGMDSSEARPKRGWTGFRDLSPDHPRV